MNPWAMNGGRLLLALGAVGALAAPALAQEARPEVMIILDSSREMGRGALGEWPVCSPRGTESPDAAVVYSQSRMNMIKDALVGSRDAPWCIMDTPADRLADHDLGADQAAPHARAMCDTGGIYSACGGDHGDNGDPYTGVDLRTGVNPDGVIPAFRFSVKFGLMTLDSHPAGPAGAVGAAQDHYSYGGESFAEPAAVIGQVNLAEAQGFCDGIAESERSPNVGIRNADAPFGALVSGNQGLLGNAGAAVDETPGSIESHNDFVMKQLRRVVPYGQAPAASMLHDAVSYYEAQAANDALDACRARYAVLVTDGSRDDLYGGAPCVLPDGACANDARCVPGWTKTANAPGGFCAGGCADGTRCFDGICETPIGVCRFDEGRPYSDSATYAAALNELGVPLFVIGMNLDLEGQQWAEAVATAGAPGYGEDGGPGFFSAENRAGLNVAFERVVNATRTGLYTRSRPVVLTPTKGDEPFVDLDLVRQWRINTFSESLGAVDATRYGRVESEVLGCAAFGDDDARPAAVSRIDVNNFEDRLPQLQSRRTVLRKPGTADLLSVTGPGGIFTNAGAFSGLLPEANVRAMSNSGLPDGVVSKDPLLVLGETLNGFFGRGLDAAGDPDDRQLGAILDGDVIAIGPPADGIASPAYQAFQNAHSARPSLVVTGAQDGLIHVFRAADGFEVLNVLPRLPWGGLRNGRFIADGPLDSATVAECRSIGNGGSPECPSASGDVQFRTLVVGGIGAGGANIFGIDITGIDALAAQGVEAQPLNVAAAFDPNPARGAVWNVTTPHIVDSAGQAAGLGMAISRPILTHVRVHDEVKAAVVVGCGQDPVEASRGRADPNAAGRCVLVIDAITGALIKRIATPEMDRPMVGDPSVYPAMGIVAAERVFIGDHGGRLWRMDLRSSNPDEWAPAIVWPPLAGDALGYTVGRAIKARPSVSTSSKGELVVVFGSTEDGADADADRFVVSLTDRAVVGAGDDLVFEAEANWVLPFGDDEYMTGPVLTRGGISYFTSIGPGAVAQAGACGGVAGRLFAVHFTDTMVDEDGNEATFARAGKTLNVMPKMPQFDNEGARQPDALALVLPPGRVAYGLTIVSTPSCAVGQASTTEIVMNLADESHGARGEVQAGRTKVETVSGGAVQAMDVSGRIFVNGSTNGLSVCLDCDAQGNPTGGMSGQMAPFSSVVSYWGSTFTN